jgi:hypothetical protein
LLKLGHTIPGKPHVKLQAFIRIEHGVAELVDLERIQRIAAALGRKRRPNGSDEWENE